MHNRTGTKDFAVENQTKAPEGAATGAAIVVFPGGGFNLLAIDIEGTEICDWVTSTGTTCILLKYRVPGGNHHWDKACRCHVTPVVPFALHDAQRAIRMVRAQASALDVDPRRIGVIGFSAGGYLVAQTSNLFNALYPPVDAIDAVSSRPDFAIALYPGHLCRDGSTLDPTLAIARNAPPTFLLQAWDDPTDDVCNSLVYARALADAGIPAEVHLFATGGHAFGMRAMADRVSSWPSLVEGWLKDIGVFEARAPGR
jgi:acetyl esterase/lipase